MNTVDSDAQVLFFLRTKQSLDFPFRADKQETLNFEDFTDL